MMLFSAALSTQAQTAAPAPTPGQAPAADAPQLQSVVVTANRRIEKLEKVPQSISVVKVDEFECNNVRELDDLIKLAPALSISVGTQVGTNSINMRGLGTTSNNLGPIGSGPVKGKISTYLTSDREYRVGGRSAAVFHYALINDAGATVKTLSGIVDGFRINGFTNLFELGRSAAAQILAAPWRPTAAIAINDMRAIGIGIGLKQLGRRIPQDLSLMGIDDIFFAAEHDPPLTTLRQPIQAMADAAVARILAPGAVAAQPGELFAPELIVRASTAAPPPRHRRATDAVGPAVASDMAWRWLQACCQRQRFGRPRARAIGQLNPE